MNEPWSTTPPPLPPSVVRRLTWMMPCLYGSLLSLFAAWEGLDPWDALFRILIIQVGMMIGWVVLITVFMPVQGDPMFWLLQCSMFNLVEPHVSLTRVFVTPLGLSVLSAILLGTIGRRWEEKIRRYLGPGIQAKTPEELARWRQDHPKFRDGRDG